MIESLSATHSHTQYLKLLGQLTTVSDITANDFEQRLDLIQSNPFHQIFVMVLDNVIIGSVTVLIEPKFIRGMSCVAHIEDVVVLETHRGHGYGKALVSHAIEYSKCKGCYKVILDCSDDMVDFYAKVGLKRKGSQMAVYF